MQNKAQNFVINIGNKSHEFVFKYNDPIFDLEEANEEPLMNDAG